ncbi:hypothetical protein AJ78_08317 [Emergomyces pasteurianus Ep9510]|uniref:Lysine-specific metallo-endopeptidase domain-containing protein n=1 Tax=Emergomyces pasteurianus Ep9510 TaxID=1447872 RepID=A0A1J9PSB4_9EURO|nr:hypothetical protein AJ78_08317 [Emergomyces pasteurianus Ep9510]
MDREAIISLLARLSPSAQGIISDLLVANYQNDYVVRHIEANSVLFCGQFRPADGVKVIATAMYQDMCGSLMNEFQQAVAADICVCDESAVNGLKKDGSHGWAMKEKRDDGNVNCAADHLNVYNVTFSDCSDQDPWAVCHCDNAQESVKSMSEKFDRVPAGLQSRVCHLVAFENKTPGGVAVRPWNIIALYGDVQDSVYMHESRHCTDRGFSESEAFLKAKELDTCWPSDYSKSSDHELFAEIGVAYLYDKSGKTLHERGFDSSCLSNGLKALSDHAGSEYEKGSKCFKREPNVKIVHSSKIGVASAESLSDMAVEVSR